MIDFSTSNTLFIDWEDEPSFHFVRYVGLWELQIYKVRIALASEIFK